MERRKKWAAQLVPNLCMVFFSVIALFPLCWVFLTAFQPTDQGVSFVLPDILAKGFTLRNFERVSELIPLWQNFWNSVVVSVVGTVLTLFFCALAGYAFAKFQFPGRDMLFLLLLFTMVIPQEVCLRGDAQAGMDRQHALADYPPGGHGGGHLLYAAVYLPVSHRDH